MEKKQCYVELKNSPIVQKYGCKRRGLSGYLLSEEEMRQQNYPLADSPSCEKFVPTGCDGRVTDGSPLFGLDCEMCLTPKGHELTRVAVVNSEGTCIMNELVKPENPIFDYLTRYSGITWNILLPVTTRLRDVQVQLKKLLPSDAVLVGHSLENDLTALQMIHPHIIDTSLLFTRDLGRRFKLKFLAEAVLGKKIQCEAGNGHDPAEDAKAALELAQYFIKQGPQKVAELTLEALLAAERKRGVSQTLTNSQGLDLHTDLHGSKPLDQHIGSLDQPDDDSVSSVQDKCSLLDALHSIGRKVILLSEREESGDPVSAVTVNRIKCSSNREVLKRARDEVPSCCFSAVQFSLDPLYERTSISEKMRRVLARMCTVRAGPLHKSFSLKSVKMMFRRCGPVRSVSVITEMERLYVCVQYKVLEGAQLATETLNGVPVDGHCIKVQRPMSEDTMLECDAVLQALEGDLESAGVLYVSGIRKCLAEEDLQEKFSPFGKIKAIVLPRKETGRHQKYCFIKYENPASVNAAVNGHLDESGRMKRRKALTPGHISAWSTQFDQSPACPALLNSKSVACSASQGTEEPIHVAEETGDSLKELGDVMRSLDRKVKKLFKVLTAKTLCVVLLTGTDRLPGLGLIGIKED
nr:PREDICTED: putative RNA exonuclease NEF-sp isoform X1 [Latimeria chalumnae]|eukprot:XP_005999678.1 PREDICTED: putative RNA exonuclease NEF-sp isoform X1 [Latimeria chalumnae]